jgi:hypothetical protein
VEHLGFDVWEVLCAGKDLIDAHRDGAPLARRVIAARFLEELTRPLHAIQGPTGPLGGVPA